MATEGYKSNAPLYDAHREQGAKRSPHWPAVEHAHKAAHPDCAACGSVQSTEVHHVLPFHLFPQHELDPENLITLCRHSPDCHIHIGHGGNFKDYNPNIRADAASLRADPTKREEIVKLAFATRKVNEPPGKP